MAKAKGADAEAVARTSKSHAAYAVASLIVLTLIGAAVYFFIWHSYAHIANSDDKPRTDTAATPASTTTLRASGLYVGEVFWGRGIEYFANRSPLGYAFPFSGLSTDTRAKYNNWMGDLECPVTTTDVPYQTQVDYLQLNCRPEYLTEAGKWFDMFTLANNHMFDSRGEIGQEETKSHLKDANIQFFGDYRPEQTDNTCEVVAYKATLEKGGTSSNATIPIAMCGYMYVVDRAPTDVELSVMEKYAEVMPVIVMPHMGVEYLPVAEQQKTDAYHAMIDAGADIVLASHPHVIQNSENYKGRLIQYSPGNFMFDQQSLEKVNTLSLGVGLTFTINDPAAIEAYTSIGESCRAYKDDCLAKLKQSMTKRPEITISYAPECFMEPNYYPKSADADTCQEILKEATWDEATKNLSNSW